jgi:shikimate dehydrogenase
MSDRYAVIGNPVAHSQSPRIHRLFARALGEDIQYGAIQGRPGHFADDVQVFRQAGGRGLNVTVPFKLDAYAHATVRTERATQAGAVNTLKFDGDDVVGDNTDGAGLVRDLRQQLDFALEGKRVLLMGAGGAARGALLPLLAERPSRIAIANRTAEKAESLAKQFARCAGDVELDAGPYEAFAGEAFDLVVNATSASLTDEIPPLPKGVFAPAALAYDMVYGERAKPFLAYALAHGAARAVDGLGMLVEQAAESFFLWRGVRPLTAPVLALLSTGGAAESDTQTRDNGATVGRR